MNEYLVEYNFTNIGVHMLERPYPTSNNAKVNPKHTDLGILALGNFYKKNMNVFNCTVGLLGAMLWSGG